MPRKAREISIKGIYHIILRGNNQQQIFEDQEDNQRFIEILKECKKLCEYQILAFCLMGNHVHLLLKPDKESLDMILRRIEIRYVFWYNKKYNRTGHLFQDRFKSETVDDNRYLLTVIRYIHQNPVKAGLSINHKYSSYNDYLGMPGSRLTDMEFLFDLINKNEFVRYSNVLNEDTCMEFKARRTMMSDEKAKEIIADLCGIKTLSGFSKLGAAERDEKIMILKKYGFPVKQLNRLTGLSRGLIQKIK